MPAGLRQVYIPEALHAILKRLAQESGESMQAAVSNILTQALLEKGLLTSSTPTPDPAYMIAQVQERLGQTPTCAVCQRPTPIPILTTDGDAYCSIGCLGPTSLTLGDFQSLAALPFVTTADGSTGALFLRASLFTQPSARPMFCHRCGKEINPGLRINATSPRRTYCHRCLRPPLWWVLERMESAESTLEFEFARDDPDAAPPTDPALQRAEDAIQQLAPVGDPI